MSRAWYFLALVPVVLGLAIAGVTCSAMVDDIKAMQRVVVHGEATKPPPRYTEATLLSAMETAGKFVEDEEAKEAMKEYLL